MRGWDPVRDCVNSMSVQQCSHACWLLAPCWLLAAVPNSCQLGISCAGRVLQVRQWRWRAPGVSRREPGSGEKRMADEVR